MGIVIRGRLAWIAAIILGIILLVIGVAAGPPFLIYVGIGFLVFGIVFLILSLATKGQSD